MPDIEPNPGRGAFSWFAYVLFHMRNSLEEVEPGRLPRWARIARGGEQVGSSGELGQYIGTGVDAILEAFPAMLEAALDLEEVLFQADAASALGQSIFDALSAAFDAEVTAAVQRVLPPGPATDEVVQIMQAISTGAATASDILDFVPAPEDVWIIGHQLYRMLCIHQRPFPRDGNGDIDTNAPELTGTEHLDVAATGKVRLCTWAYRHSMLVRHVDEGAIDDQREHVKNFSLGSRRLHTGTLATRASMLYEAPIDNVRVFDFDFVTPSNNNRPNANLPEDAWTVDIAELIELLQQRDYGTGTGGTPDITGATTITIAVREALMQFQAINELEVTGEVDNSTINRLFNLDFERKNVRRAKPYDSAYPFPWLPGSPFVLAKRIEVVNAGADDYEDESITLLRKGTRYAYYPVRVLADIGNADWTKNQGWISDDSVGLTRGFVAMQTRLINPDAGTEEFPSATGRFDGGRWSEGDSATGRFFWAARHTEPWRAGRTGTPDPAEQLFPGPAPTPGAVSRMYQWIPLDNLPPATPPPGAGLVRKMWCSVLQRSLFSDRGMNGLPDQGRVRLEFYDGAVDTRRVRPGSALAAAVLPAFPDHTDMPFIPNPDNHSIDEIDGRRVWFYRRTGLIEIPLTATMACLVVEGIHQSAWDIDGYFDDFRVGFCWHPNS